MNDQTTFLKTQEIDLEHMLEEAKDDPVLAPQLEQRLRATRKTLQAQAPDGTLFPPVIPEMPRAAIFFRGSAVEGSTGIRPALAGEALIHYEKMFVEQAMHDESGFFDLVLEDGLVLTGTVADAFTEEDLDRIDSLTNKKCIASLQETRITKQGKMTSSFILLDAESNSG